MNCNSSHLRLIRRPGLAGAALAVLACAFANQFTALAAAETGQRARILITENIDDRRLVTLRGNTRPEALDPTNDRGVVDDRFLMAHMLLQLRRPAELEQEFEHFIDQLTDKTSPNFRHWLLPTEQGQLYGPAQTDLDKLKAWLESHGFIVNYIYASGMVMDISGTAGQIREAFHTEIHNLDVHGEPHYANVSDPQIPEALAPLVVGIVSMHNFKPKAMNEPRLDYTFAGCGTLGTCYALAPADLQVIYNLDPLYRLGLNGAGQTIVLIEDSDTYSNDVATYRTTFLGKYTGTVTLIHPGGANTCTDPGTTGDDAEADLDAEVASAIAPNATIEVASCADTTTFGGLLAIENLVNSATPPAVLSLSYGECEAVNGASSNAAFNSAFQTGAAAGTSVFVSAGDSGASSCAPLFTYGSTNAYSGVGVTGWGETVYNVSVGGTDFEDTYNAKLGSPATPVSTYWNSTNTGTESSAKSYIPEIPWNDSCAGYLLYNYLGYASGYGSTGLCTVSAYESTSAGSGGPSNCATGGGGLHQIEYAVADGTCTGYAKPAWQSGIFGNPADGARDVPDVSLFAGNGIWGHYVIICFSDTANKGTSCAGAPSSWSGFGGTSIGAPTMASIQALVNQEWGIRAGNPNPTYYSIAKAEFGLSGASACYSINQLPDSGLASSCVFYDITQGDDDVDCAYNPGGLFRSEADGVGCYLPSGTYGAVVTQALTTGTVTAAGSGYTSAPTCTIGAPSNMNEYLSPGGAVLWAGGTQATCTATLTGHTVASVTIGATGSGYAGGASCTLTGGGGTGATCSVSPVMGTVAATYQPAYGTTPGWDFATGIGSVNAYNLVFNSAW
jgi:hypothetical protein